MKHGTNVHNPPEIYVTLQPVKQDSHMINDPRHIRISDYNYPLPDERIAKFPLHERDQSKLLVYRNGHIGEDSFAHLPEYLEKGDLMVFNNTKVIQARLHFRKDTGALIEVFCLEPFEPHDYAQNFQQTEHAAWLCMVGNLKKWKEGTLQRELTVKGGRKLTLTATRGECHGTSHRVDFRWDNTEVTFADILEMFGELPIPPYLNRATEESDKETYQTVYSKIKGSVAAPTAGLHFTDRVLADLQKHGIDTEELTLHVGAGTFRPVKSEEIEGHEMHTEYISVPRRTLQRLIDHGGQAIAVGTTSVRTLESLYHIGVALLHHPEREDDALHVGQWQPYETVAGETDICTTDALRAVAAYLDRHGLDTLHTSTQIIIAPGYRYRVVKAMVTNFHQPQSTLLLLVSAFVGEDWRNIYRYALDNGFRFLSYGDSSLLFARHDNGQEMFPVVDEAGNITGAASRAECHNGSKLLHPVVHLHVFNSQGQLYLQKRPAWKDIQPGRWDTAVGGHIDLGENVEQALRREAKEELGIEDFTPEQLDKYVFESERERELVFTFRTVYDGPILPSSELDGGRFWPPQEIREKIDPGDFTPNFVNEIRRVAALRDALLPGGSDLI